MKGCRPIRPFWHLTCAWLLVTAALWGSGPGRSVAADVPVLRLSMIPTTDPGKMVRDSAPLIAYLEREIGARIDMTVPLNYAAVVEAMVNDKVDIAHFGGFTYVQASARAGVRPLVQRLQDQQFHSLFITQPDSPIHALTDLRGHTFAFGDVNSTSGHLMPEHYLRQANVDASVIARAIYTGGHDATALAVANKKVDAGALDELIFKRLIQDGRITSSQVRVFYTTPPFLDYVWAARKTLDPRLAEKFAQGLLRLDTARPQDRPILEFLAASRYVRATDASYDQLRQAARDAELLK
jgi:phosphonate transport system substrate-binding protein